MLVRWSSVMSTVSRNRTPLATQAGFDGEAGAGKIQSVVEHGANECGAGFAQVQVKRRLSFGSGSNSPHDVWRPKALAAVRGGMLLMHGTVASKRLERCRRASALALLSALSALVDACRPADVASFDARQYGNHVSKRTYVDSQN